MTTTAKDEGPNRRRHHRAPAPIVVTLTIAGESVPIVKLIDASLGGALLELPSRDLVPPLASRGTARVVRGSDVVERGARVVRIRWGGRELGVQLAPAIALVFDDDDADAALRLDKMLLPLAPT